jgi:hypothetical protein
VVRGLAYLYTMLVRSDSVSDFSAATVKQEEDEEHHGGIARKETTTVNLLKLAVAVVLVVSLIGAAMAVHRYTRGIELAKFRDAFRSDAQKIVEAIESSLEKTLSSFDSLAVSLISQAIASNSTWPFVTLPHFGVRVAKILPASNALFVNFLPLVQTDERLEWELYASQNDYWVNESLDLQKTWDGYYGPSIEEWSPNPSLHYLQDLPYNVRCERLLEKHIQYPGMNSISSHL